MMDWIGFQWELRCLRLLENLWKIRCWFLMIFQNWLHSMFFSFFFWSRFKLLLLLLLLLSGDPVSPRPPPGLLLAASMMDDRRHCLAPRARNDNSIRSDAAVIKRLVHIERWLGGQCVHDVNTWTLTQCRHRHQPRPGPVQDPFRTRLGPV